MSWEHFADSMDNVRSAIKALTETTIDESVYKGICSVCHKPGPVVRVLEGDICDHCLSFVQDKVSESGLPISDEVFTLNSVVGQVYEGYIHVDMAKLKAEASKNPQGIPGVMKSYGLQVKSDYDDDIQNDNIFIMNKDHISGTTKLNRFMIDFDAEFISARTMSSHVPDADGTLAPMRQYGKGLVKPPAGSGTKVPPAPKATSSASSVSSVSNVQASGGVISFGMAGVTVTASLTTQNAQGDMYEVKRGNDTLAQVTVPSGIKPDQVVAEILKYVSDNPGQIFPTLNKDGQFSIFYFGLNVFEFSGKERFVMKSTPASAMPGSITVPISGAMMWDRAEMSKNISKALAESLSKLAPDYAKNPSIPFAGNSLDIALVKIDNKAVDLEISHPGPGKSIQLTLDLDDFTKKYPECVYDKVTNTPAFLKELGIDLNLKGTVSTKDSSNNFVSVPYSVEKLLGYKDTGEVVLKITYDIGGNTKSIRLPYYFKHGLKAWIEKNLKSSINWSDDDVLSDKKSQRMKTKSSKMKLMSELEKATKKKLGRIRVDGVECDYGVTVDIKLNGVGSITQFMVKFTDDVEVPDKSRGKAFMDAISGAVKTLPPSSISGPSLDSEGYYFCVLTFDPKHYKEAIKYYSLDEAVILEAFDLGVSERRKLLLIGG